MPGKPHICVCICTYKRPLLIKNLLEKLERQETAGLFDSSIVVVDNDRYESGRQSVEAFAKHSKIPVTYHVEPVQNIALARNKGIANSNGDFIAFIDDDEVPSSRWLVSLYKALALFETAGVLGPVLPLYGASPPSWVLSGEFFTRPTYFSGYFLDYEITRMGNCLLRSYLFKEKDDWFLAAYGRGGEDRDFFKRKIAQGHVFVWCREASLFEVVPPERWGFARMLKRALLRGRQTYIAEKNVVGSLLGSGAAFLGYSLSLPLLFILSPVFGYDVFVKYIIRDFDHIGKLAAFFGVDLVKERYVI
jgi:succinoglycan biosynthesis protein ExoM